MNKEELEVENKRLRTELFELKIQYKDLVRKYRKIHDEWLLMKVNQLKEDKNDNIGSK